MFPTLLLTAVASLLIYQIYQKWKDYQRMWKHAVRIPGPKGVPILGNIPELLKALRENTIKEKTLEHCIEYKSIHKYYDFDNVEVLVYNPQDIETILTSSKLITKGKTYDGLHDWLGTGLLTSTGSKWQNRRKILTPAFHFSILQDFLGIFNRETENLVNQFRQHVNKPVNIIQPITEFTLSSIGETSLGVQINKENNCSKYKKAIYDFGETLVERGFRPWLTYPIIKQVHPISRKSTDAVKTLHGFSTKIIQKRKLQIESSGSYSANKRLALLDLLLKAKYKDGVDMDDEGIREEVDTFMFEGHDTTAVSLCYTLVLLANEEQFQSEIYQEIVDVLGDKKYPDSKDLSEMTFMERCVKESLRLYPSVPNIFRHATEDIATKDGYIIPRGSEVNIAIFELHRLPHLWERPDEFNPDRFLPENISGRHPFLYIPFSAGPRNCIGQKYAMMELKAAICGILREFKLEPVTRRSDIKYKMDMVLRPLEALNIKFVKRK